MLSKLSGEPPSQYWNDIMNDRASLALSLGRNLSTLGRVRRSFNMPSSKDEPSSWKNPEKKLHNGGDAA
jgi:hypothetical protein